MRIGVLTTLWRRHALARIVLDHYVHLDLFSVLLAVGSEGRDSQSLAESCGWQYMEYPNHPLSDKWNAGMEALRGRVDAVMIVGSDDIVTERAIRMLIQSVEDGSDAVGLKDLYYYDTREEKAYYGERHNPGAGMTVSASALERVGWKPWGSGLNRYLDRSFTNRMQTKAYPCKFKYLKNCREQAADLVDIKTDTNMWSLEQLAAATERVHPVSLSDFDSTFPDLREQLKHIG
jgi:hypothetical protein